MNECMNLYCRHQHRKGHVYTTLPVTGAEFTASVPRSPLLSGPVSGCLLCTNGLGLSTNQPNESHTAT